MGFYFSESAFPCILRHSTRREKKGRSSATTHSNTEHKQKTPTQRIKLQNSKKRNKFIWLGFGCWLRSMRSPFFPFRALFIKMLEMLLNYYFEWFYCGRSDCISLRLFILFGPMDGIIQNEPKKQIYPYTHMINQQLFFFSSCYCRCRSVFFFSFVAFDLNTRKKCVCVL